MKKKTYKIIICISLVVMLFTSFGNIFGATNPDYTPTIQVSENALDGKIKDSILLDALANMINAIASLAEYLIGAIFKALTGDNIFPWADRIIFNGIGFLDINFLNASDNSLFVYNGEDSILGQVVKSVYSTIFSLAVLFLGVAVGVMAIRLAISSIAAEKAKYKQAIVNWATCIVMLFLMHYILAFVFWVNEQLVQIASGILIQTIEDRKLGSVDFTEALASVVKPEERVVLFCETAISMPDGILDLADTWYKNKTVAHTAQDLKDNYADVANRLLINSDYVDNRLVYVEDNHAGNFWTALMQNIGDTNQMVAEIGLPRLYLDSKDAAAIKGFVENSDKKTVEDQRKKGFYNGADGRKIYIDKEAYLASNDFEKDAINYAYCVAKKDEGLALYTFYANHPEYKLNNGDNPNRWQAGINAVWTGISHLGLIGYIDDNYDKIKESNIYKSAINDPQVRNSIAELRLRSDNYIVSAATGVKASSTDIIANLGAFFKQSAYVYTSEKQTTGTGDTKEVITGWRASKLSVTGALLYAIFIFQSCMYLIMYVKRLFFVMMLSMFGPIVVIYDFFMKSAS